MDTWRPRPWKSPTAPQRIRRKTNHFTVTSNQKHTHCSLLISQQKKKTATYNTTGRSLLVSLIVI